MHLEDTATGHKLSGQKGPLSQNAMGYGQKQTPTEMLVWSYWPRG